MIMISLSRVLCLFSAILTIIDIKYGYILDRVILIIMNFGDDIDIVNSLDDDDDQQ